MFCLRIEKERFIQMTSWNLSDETNDKLKLVWWNRWQVETCLTLFRHVKTRLNLLRYVETRLNLFRQAETCTENSKTLQKFETFHRKLRIRQKHRFFSVNGRDIKPKHVMPSRDRCQGLQTFSCVMQDICLGWPRDSNQTHGLNNAFQNSFFKNRNIVHYWQQLT